MSDKEVALRLTEARKVGSNETYPTIYLRILDEIRNYKSKSIIGKLEELFYEYDKKTYYCEYDKNKLIDDIRKIVEGDE